MKNQKISFSEMFPNEKEIAREKKYELEDSFGGSVFDMLFSKYDKDGGKMKDKKTKNHFAWWFSCDCGSRTFGISKVVLIKNTYIRFVCTSCSKNYELKEGRMS